MPFALIEPLRELFKDEVRRIGKDLSLPSEILVKQRVTGPGLAEALPGENTRTHLVTRQDADAIVVEEIRRAGLYEKVWQAFAVLLTVRCVGVMGDGRTYGLTVAVIFFFSSRRRHTSSLCDWSSDVCSSDLKRRWPSPAPGSLIASVRRKRQRLANGAFRRREARRLPGAGDGQRRFGRRQNEPGVAVGHEDRKSVV